MGRPGGHRLVFFAYYYPPLGGAGSLRALSFARHLPTLGWEVTVVTPREGVYGRDPSLAGDALPGVEVIRTGTWEPAVLLRRLRGQRTAGAGARGGEFVEEAKVGAVGALVKRAVRGALYFPDSAKGWVRTAATAARKAHCNRPFDAVLSSSPPVSAHLAARSFAAATGVPWIADWRDPWADSLADGDRSKPRAVRLERELGAAATRFVAATDGLARLMGERIAAGPAVAIRNGFEPDDFPTVTTASDIAEPTIVFTGTHYGSRQDLRGFFTAASRLLARRRFRIRFLGKVDQSTPAAAVAAGLSDAVSFEGFATHEESLRATAAAAALLLPVWSEDTPRGRLICPAKMYEYLASGRPIVALALPGSEAEGLLKGVQGVRVVGFEDEVDIEQAIEAALDGRLRRPEGGGDLSGFTRLAQARRLAAVLDQVAGAAR